MDPLPVADEVNAEAAPAMPPDPTCAPPSASPSERHGVQHGVSAEDLAAERALLALARAWPGLSPEIRAAVLRVAGVPPA